MKDDKKEATTETLVGEVQIILAEKRTALSVLRTGIAVFALPLSVLSLLVATSKYYQPAKVLQFLLPLLVLSAALAGLGSYLVIHEMLRIRHYDRRLNQLKRQSGAIAELIE
jgi:hypothetical protein